MEIVTVVYMVLLLVVGVTALSKYAIFDEPHQPKNRIAQAMYRWVEVSGVAIVVVYLLICQIR